MTTGTPEVVAQEKGGIPVCCSTPLRSRLDRREVLRHTPVNHWLRQFPHVVTGQPIAEVAVRSREEARWSRRMLGQPVEDDPPGTTTRQDRMGAQEDDRETSPGQQRPGLRSHAADGPAARP